MVKFTPRIVGSGLVATVVLGGLVSAENCPVAALPTRPVIVSQATAESFFQRGEQRYWEDDFRGAIDNYTQAIRLNPSFAAAYINRGLSRFGLQDFQGAIADYTQAIRLNPNFAYAYADRGSARFQLKDFQGAIADCNQAIRLNPSFADPYIRRGEAYYWLSDYQRALADSDRALQVPSTNPDDPVLQRRIRLKPNYDTASAIRGAAQMGLKDYRAAQADLDEGVSTSWAMGTNGHGFAFYFRGLFQLRQGNYRAAITDYQEALKRTPSLQRSKVYEDYSLVARRQLNPPVASQSPPATTAARPQPTNTAAIDPPKPAVAPSPPNVYKIAKATTLLIEGQSSGSGVIISKVGNTYFVLTAKHVVQSQQEYTVTTSSGKKYPLDYKQIKKLADLDLAVAQFTSNENLSVAQLGNSETVDQGDVIYVSGWPAEDQAITKRSQFASKGEIAGVQPGNADGYELMYGNSTGPGMSGGPIFNSNGQVVGIHGRAAGNEGIGKVGINLGIPVHLFLRQAPQAGLNLNQLGLRAGK
jgi:tetratricopeptide (TPR) repeat protein